MLARTRAALVRAAAFRETVISLRRFIDRGDVSMVTSTLSAIIAGLRFPLARSVLAGSGGGVSGLTGSSASGEGPSSASEGISSGSGQAGRMTVVEGEVTIDVNPLAGLEGCSAHARAELRAAIREVVRLAVQVLKSGVQTAEEGGSPGQLLQPTPLTRFSSVGGASVATVADEEEEEEERGEKAQLAARHAALLAIAQDYNIGDAPILLDSGVLPVLRALAFMRSSTPSAETRASQNPSTGPSSGAGATESKEADEDEGESKEETAAGDAGSEVHRWKSARVVA